MLRMRYPQPTQGQGWGTAGRRTSRFCTNQEHIAVLLNSQLGELFKTAVGVRQKCLLSLILFNLFIEITRETFHDHHTAISIGGSPIICNLQFANIDLVGGSSDEQTRRQSNGIWKRSQHRNEQDHDNSTNNIGVDIGMKGQKLEEVTSSKYLGATLCKDGTCAAEVRIRIASTKAAGAKLNRILRCNTIRFASTFKLYKSLVTSIHLYGCDSWTLLADFKKKKRIQASETKRMRKLLAFSTWSTRPTTWCGTRSTSLWILRNLFRQLSRDGNWHNSSSKPSFRVGDAVVGRGNPDADFCCAGSILAQRCSQVSSCSVL